MNDFLNHYFRVVFRGLTPLVLAVICGGMAQADEGAGAASWQWRMGLDERARWEYLQDFDLKDQLKDKGSLFFQRLRLNVRAAWQDTAAEERAVIFFEGLDAQSGGYQLKPVAGQRDDFDLHQAYVQLKKVGDTAVDLKAGRMEVKYGSGRLIAQPSWSNRMRHFDGGIMHYAGGGGFLDALYLQDVKYDDNQFNRSSGREFLTGLYGGYQADPKTVLYEAYALPQVIKTSSAEIERYTVGARLKGGLSHGIGWELEIPWQFGTNGHQDIQAYAVNVSVSKGWDAGWKPKLFLEYNQASGDKDATDGESNTFVPLYQTTHDPYGLLDFFRWQNMREIALKLDVKPLPKWTVSPQGNVFWLDNRHDAWYSSSGSVKQAPLAAVKDTFAGTELSLRACYDIDTHIKWESGYAHFFPGDYAESSGLFDDTNWLYTQLTLKY